MIKTLCNDRSEENRTRYNAICNKTKKVVARAMRMEIEKKIETFSESFTEIFKFLKMMKKEGKSVKGGKCVQDIDRKLGVHDIDRKKIWKQHMEKIMDEEND